MSITNKLNQIKNAIYGKEVRGAIHDAIKQVYDDASVNHDNANMEVKMARGTHNTLNDRLNKSDEIQAQTNAQLLETANRFNEFEQQTNFNEVNISMLQNLPKDYYSLSTTTVTSNNDHAAFTSMIKFNDVIYLIYRRGSGHATYDGVLYMKSSSDLGASWGSEVKVIELAGYDCRDPFFIEFNGRVVLKFVKRYGNDRRKVCVMSSSDMVHWTTHVELPNPIGTSDASRGNMCVKDNELYTINYDMWGGTFLLKTSDLVNWTVVNPLILKNTNEASISYRTANNKFFALFRVTDGDRGQLILGISDDGVKWTFRNTPFRGHCPTIETLQLSTFGTFQAVTFRDVSQLDSSISRVKFNLTFVDEHGYFVINPIQIDVQRGFDIGYGDIVSLDSKTLGISYYKLDTNNNSFSNIHFEKMSKTEIYDKILNKKEKSISWQMPYISRHGERSIKVLNGFYCGEVQVTGDGTQRKTFRIDLSHYNFTSGQVELVNACVTNDVFHLRLKGITNDYIEFTLVCDNAVFTSTQLVKYSFFHRS